MAVNLLGKNGESYEIVGKPLRSITAGKEFEAIYENVRQRLGDVDLGAIWIIEPLQIKNETFAVRVTEDEEKYPILKHLLYESGTISQQLQIKDYVSSHLI